jgi:dihydroflavonol-4-reductase
MPARSIIKDIVKEQKMRVLISGGTGFIGQHLTRGALKKGWQVTLMVREPNTLVVRSFVEDGVEIVVGDVTDIESVRTAFATSHPTLYYHNAGWYELGIPRRYRSRMRAVNVDGLENCLRGAAEAGVEKVVYTSSTTALGDTEGEIVGEEFTRRTPPITYYERTKAEAHALALRHQYLGEPIVIACPAQAIGPADHSPFGHFSRLFLRGLLPPLIWAPRGAFTFGHVEDVADALIRSGESGRAGETYFIGGHVLELKRLMTLWGEVTGRRPPFIWLPKPVAVMQSAIVAPLLRLMGQPAFISPEVVRNSFVSYRYRSSKAEEELGVFFRSAEQGWCETLEGEARRAGIMLP